MASDKFEVGDILVCVDGSAHGGYGEGLKVGKIYEVERPNGSRECYLVGNWHSWFNSRFRRATLDEIRKYRKEQGYEKHQFAIGELVVCIALDYGLLHPIGQTCVVSATKSDDEHECFIDIDGGKVPGRHFAAKFRKATPAEAAAYRKAKEAPATKKGKRLFYSLDSIGTAEVGDLVVFRRDFNVLYLDGGARIIDAIAKDGNGKVTSLKVRNPETGDWDFTDPDYWVPVGKGYELVGRDQPIQPGDQWLEYGKWMTTDLEGCFPADELLINGSVHPLRRKIKDAATVQIGNKPPFKAAVLNPPTFNLTFTWEGPEKMPLSGNDSPESISKAISVPNPQTLTSADGREFDIIDWNPKVKTGEVVTVEANLMPKLAKEPKPKPEPKPEPAFQVGSTVVCVDGYTHPALGNGGVLSGKAYRIRAIRDNIVDLEGPAGRGWYKSRFRLATPAEAQAFLDAEKKAQFSVGNIVVCVDTKDDGGKLTLGKSYRITGIKEDGEFDFVQIDGITTWGGGFYPSRFRLATPAEAQAFLDAEKKAKKLADMAKIDPGAGYRLLEPEELVVEGDEVWGDANHHWDLSSQWATSTRKQIKTLVYRRRCEFAKGELVQIIKPATQALLEINPFWNSGGGMDYLDGMVIELGLRTEPSYRDAEKYKIPAYLHPRRSDRRDNWHLSSYWLAPATEAQKAKYKEQKAKKQEIEAKIKDLQSQIAPLIASLEEGT